jgi:hypothetical protein
MKPAPVIGTYHLLHICLRDRFANRVVLTFAEIEDLLGFHLPDPARLDRSGGRLLQTASDHRSRMRGSSRTGRRASACRPSVVFDRLASP